MKKSTLHHIAMYQNVLAVINNHQPVWSGVPGMVTAVAQFSDLLNDLSNRLNVQSTVTQGIRLEKQAFLDQFKAEMTILKKALFLYAVETGNLSLRERNKESKTKLAVTPADRLEILSIHLMADLETYGSQLGTVGITNQQIQDFSAKVSLLEGRKNSVRQAIIERSMETQEIRELEKQLNRLLIDRLDRFITFFKATDSSFVNTYHGARRIIGKGGNAGPRVTERDDGARA